MAQRYQSLLVSSDAVKVAFKSEISFKAYIANPRECLVVTKRCQTKEWESWNQYVT